MVALPDMPELCCMELSQLLPEFLSTLAPFFYRVKCEVIECPNLSKAPFNLPLMSFGQLIYIIPDSICKEEARMQIPDGNIIATTNGFHVVSDGRLCKLLEISLSQKASLPKDYRTAVGERIDKILGINWEFLWIEFYKDEFQICLLNNLLANPTELDTNEKEIVKIWVVPINRRIVAGCTKKIRRKKSTKNSLSDEISATKDIITLKNESAVQLKTNGDRDCSTNCMLVPVEVLECEFDSIHQNGTQIKKEKLSVDVIKENKVNGHDHDEVFKASKLPNFPSLKQNENNGKSDKHSPNSLELATLQTDHKQQTNKNGKKTPCSFESLSNSVSPSSFNEVRTVEKSENSDDEFHSLHSSNASSPPLPKVTSVPITSDSERRSVSAFSYKLAPNTAASPMANSIRRQTNGINSRFLGASNVNKLSPISSCDSMTEETDGKWKRVCDGENDGLVALNEQNGSVRRGLLLDHEEDLSLRDDLSSYSIASTAFSEVGRRASSERSQKIFQLSSLQKNPFGLSKENSSNSYASSWTSTLSGNDVTKRPSYLKSSGQLTTQPDVLSLVRGMQPLHVSFFQQVLAKFSYKELGEIRRVHPHWDELCGQRMNSGYYKLIHIAGKLLSDCKKKVALEPHLDEPIRILNNLHLYVLNPVDSLRSFIDEGIVCFPYGLILDKAFDLLTKIETIMLNLLSNTEGHDLVYQCEDLLRLSQRAQSHYRKTLEPEAEKRMSEVYRLSAAQQAAHQLQRIDSFLMEANVNKLERTARDADKAREDLKWEMEQLKGQNQQLKKDNRDLRACCARLDQRVEVLERKFKTMARLLQ